jgi:hypothetical protein
MPSPAVALIAGGSAIASGVIGAKGAKSAAKAQADAADRAAQLQKEQFDKQVELQEPFRQGGIRSLNELQRQLGLAGDPTSAGYGSLMRDFGVQDFQADPGYAFRMSEGLKALDRQAAHRGGLISGAALKAAQGYGQDLASQEYQNAFNRYQANRSTKYGMLSGQQGVGQQAVGAMGQAGQNYANQAGEAYMGAGNARASGYMGQANAWGNALGNIGTLGTLYGMGAFDKPSIGAGGGRNLMAYNYQQPMYGNYG